MLGLTSSAQVVVTAHFKKQMTAKGFDWKDATQALKSPYKITDVRRYPGQKRYCGSGLAVVLKEVAPGHYSLITVYEDGVVTPLRPDQMNDPHALNSRRILARG